MSGDLSELVERIEKRIRRPADGYMIVIRDYDLNALLDAANRVELMTAELDAWANEVLNPGRGMGSEIKAYPRIPPSAAKELRRIAALSRTGGSE